jgi:hypothetical protein
LFIGSAGSKLITRFKRMKRVFIFILLMASFSLKAADRLSHREAARIADAIYIAEGGKKAKVPYGILSIKVRSAEHARQICLNTIHNNYERWQKAGRRGEFLNFLADRYCPPTDATGNKNWKRNVKTILSRSSLKDNSRVAIK